MRLIKSAFPIRVIALLCVALILISTLLSCSQVSQNNDDRPLVVTTIFPPYDFARNVAGEYADVELLVDVTDSHSYSPTAVDMVKIEECDIFIYTGGEGDRWAEDFLSNIDCTDKIVINMLETVDFLLYESNEAHHDHEHEQDESVVYDEHVWLAPNNATQITCAISDALCRIDPDSAEYYQMASESYGAQLEELDSELEAVVTKAQRHTILVADRFPFRYLCEAYGLSYYAALPGCSSAADLTAIEYEHLSEQLRNNDLPVIFTAEFSDGTIARTVKHESGREDVTILTLHSCHTLSRGQINEGNSYLSLMRENIAALKKALG